MVESFETFYRSFEPQIFGYLWRMCGDEHAALDMTQETFLRAWQRYVEVCAYQRPDSWLYRVATRLALNHARQRKRHVRALGKLQSHELAVSNEAVIESGDGDAVLQTLQMLATRDRAALVLHSVYGLTCAELAATLHISEGAAKVLLWRGRERFRRMYVQLENDL
ncbi:MAG: RNA polymerase sigma factor [Ktedonobacterales bacterium]